METRHVRLDYAQSLNGKKQILSSEISLIYVARTLSKYKFLRKKELVLKNQLRSSLASLRVKLNSFSSMLPVTPKSPIMHKPPRKESTKEDKNLSEELKDIQQISKVAIKLLLQSDEFF